jgi:TolB-like protein
MPIIFEFAGHRLDISRGTLRAGDRDIVLRPKSFAVLCLLVENAGRLLSKDELIRSIWPDAAVGEEALTHCISEIRRALDDVNRGIIVTVPRRGYRFESAVLPLPSVPASPAMRDAHMDVPTHRRSELALPSRPSIAVLPFRNMSDDLANDYFADGIVEDITTALSRFSDLFVIARNSTFAYKGRAVDIEPVGRELGVRYVVQGSIRQSASRLRIAAQLLEAKSGRQLWADRIESTLDDLFDMQDHAAASIVTAIVPKLEHAEIARTRYKLTDRLDAYDYHLRGMDRFYRNTRESVLQAIGLFSKSIELDPDFAAPYGMAAYCYVQRRSARWATDFAWEVAEATRLAREAARLGSQDAASLSRAGHALAVLGHEYDAAEAFIDRALAVNPNASSAWFSSGWLRLWTGDANRSVNHFAKFMRISPLDFLKPDAQSASAFAHAFAGRNDEAVVLAERALRENPTLPVALRASAMANALAGRIDRARTVMARLVAVDPTVNLSHPPTPFRRPGDYAKFAEGMLKAGVPR